ncbi:MAG: glycosyltransferase family 4 protein [Dehalococcoidia bacterium]|nr:glycosyltransferase family 4 protein [Dehalococcoidia bacterium]
MHVGIDYTPAVRQRAGIGRFTRDLIAAVLRRRSDDRFTLIVTRDAPCASPAPNARVIPLPFSERLANILWHRLFLPLPVTVFTGPVDVFHGTNFLLPPLRRTPGVVTVHDLTYRLFPQFAEPSLTQFLTRATPATLRRARRICADSAATKRDLCQLLGVAPDLVTVVYGGVSPQFCAVPDPVADARVARHYPVDRPYLFALGALEPRKNLAGLLDAYAILRAAGLAPRLLIAGPPGWRNAAFATKLASSPYRDDVVSLGFVPDDDLPPLFRRAACFVYPSFYEGFGLPVLEALACGAPVVCGDRGSVPEVAGDAAITVDVADPTALASAIRRVLDDDVLADHLRVAGPRQASRFDWETEADRLYAVYQEAAAP